MKLRVVSPKDSKVLVDLMRQLGYETTESELLESIETHTKNNHTWSYVLEIDATPVACASYHLIPYFHQKGAMMRVTSLVVDSRFKRKGLGRMLMDQAVILAKAHSCDKIELTTSGHRSNEAHRFYEALGYKEYDGIRYLRDM